MSRSFEEYVAELRSKRASVRRKAAEGLGRLGDRRALDVLAPLLADDHIDVSLKAVQALGRLHDERAVPALISVLEEPLSDVAEAAARVLVRFRKHAVQPLIVALGQMQFSHMCYPAWILGKIRDRSATPALVSLCGHSDPGVREDVVVALGQLRDSRAIGPLLQALRDPTVAAKAAEAIGLLGRPEAVPALLEALAAPDAALRACAATSLGALGDPSAVPALVDLSSDPDESARGAACSALAQLADARAREALVARLSDSSEVVRMLACEALGRLGDPSVSAQLLPLLESHDGAALAAAKALGDLEDSTAVEALEAAARFRNLWIVKGAFAFFIRRGVPSTVPVLVETLNRHGSLDDAILASGSGHESLVEAAQAWSGRGPGRKLKVPKDAPRWGCERDGRRPTRG